MAYVGAQPLEGIARDVDVGSARRALAYRPDIDGLRALAVVPVILFHLDKSFFPAGYLGVDVFFVISGFLITSLLLREWENDKTLSLIAFWRRRILRIVPALAVMVAVTFCLGQLLLYAPERYDLSVNSAAALLSLANITHWLNYGSYWGAAADSSPLLHTWSLSVEEQFYFIYPVALLLILTHARRWLAPVLLAGLLLSFATYCWGIDAKPAATFYLLPTRAWELAMGALAATLCFQRGSATVANPVWSAAGLLLVAAGYFLIRGDGLSYFLWVPVLGTALLLSFNLGPGCFTTRFLSSSPLVAIGKISYSLYLWHWPIFLLSRPLADRYDVAANPWVLLAVVVVVSIASYKFVEQPARRAPKLTLVFLAGMVGLAVVTYSVRNQNTSESVDQFAPTRWEGLRYNVNPNQEWPAAVVRRMAGIALSPPATEQNAYARGGIRRLYGAAAPEVIVLGDSHGLMWAPAIDAAAKELKLSIAFFTADGTPVFFNIPLEPAAKQSQFFTSEEMRQFNRTRLAALRELRPKVVVIAARWSSYKAGTASDLLREVEAIGAKAVLIGDPPYLDIGDTNAPQYLSYKRLRPGADPLLIPVEGIEYQKARDGLASIASTCKTCTIVDVEEIFLQGNDARVTHKDEVLYIDDDHLSVAGAMLARQKLVVALAQASTEKKE